MFENKTINGIHYTRFIASYYNVCKDPSKIYLLGDWLKHLNLSEDEIHDIIELKNCGKLELEADARIWLKNEAPKIIEEDKKLNKIDYYFRTR